MLAPPGGAESCQWARKGSAKKASPRDRVPSGRLIVALASLSGLRYADKMAHWLSFSRSLSPRSLTLFPSLCLSVSLSLSLSLSPHANGSPSRLLNLGREPPTQLGRLACGPFAAEITTKSSTTGDNNKSLLVLFLSQLASPLPFKTLGTVKRRQQPTTPSTLPNIRRAQRPAERRLQSSSICFSAPHKGLPAASLFVRPGRQERSSISGELETRGQPTCFRRLGSSSSETSWASNDSKKTKDHLICLRNFPADTWRDWGLILADRPHSRPTPTHSILSGGAARA